MQNTQISAHSLTETSNLLDQTGPCIVHLADMTLDHGPGEHGAFLLTGAQTDDRVTASYCEVDINAGPPPHAHANAEEIFVIQSGAFELLVNGELVVAKAGDVAYMARGEAHRFRGLDNGEANTFNVIVAPSGFENFLTRWYPLFENGAPSMEDAIRLTSEHDITLYPSDDATPPVPANPQTKVIRGDQQPELSVMGARVKVLLSAQDTEGCYGMVRVEGPRDFGPPVHIHEHEDEMFIVETGQVEFTLDEEIVVAEKGDMVWAPRGYAHTFRLRSDDARILAFITPGGVEEFFVECDRLEASGEATLSALIDLNAKFGMTFPAH
ncbi:quercetin 2,3-dioxygenase [Abditibacteriota bacterium]|nr:quercetin 2,3-dioxygenase [Abditibacteriota bacterium]